MSIDDQFHAWQFDRLLHVPDRVHAGDTVTIEAAEKRYTITVEEDREFHDHDDFVQWATECVQAQQNEELSKHFPAIQIQEEPSSCPIGDIQPCIADEGIWKPCDGSSFNPVKFKELYKTIGRKYGQSEDALHHPLLPIFPHYFIKVDNE